MMTVKTFKKLCMKAATARSDEVHDYYIKLENTYLEYIKLKYVSEIEQKNDTVHANYKWKVYS